MLLWTAFVLGLVGGLHCAGMCGPLMLALPPVGANRAVFVAGRLLNALGRMTTYCGLGVAFGSVGKSLALVGLQRWTSILLGACLLAALMVPRRVQLARPLTALWAWLRAPMGALLQQRSLLGLFALGTLNGLLPCGLVYVAGAGAAAAGDLPDAVLYMAAFGLGTAPTMLALSLWGRGLQNVVRRRFARAIPIAVAIMALLLILRGLALGIPYLSPDLAAPGDAVCCPAPHVR